MANYISGLSRMASAKISGAGSDFLRGVKGAFMSEVPALSAASGFKSSLQKYSKDAESSVKEQKINNVISLEMVRQLRVVNANISNQTRIAAAAEQRAQRTAAFAEEIERERAIRDDKLLKAIQNIQAANDMAYGGRGGGFLQSAKESLLERLGVTAAGAAAGSAAGGMIGRFAPVIGRLLMNPYVLGAIAAAVGAIVLFKNKNQDKQGKIGFGDGGAMNDAINTGGMTPSGTTQYVPPSGDKPSPLAVRNNNPGNLRPPGSKTGFQKFRTPQEGIAALERQLTLYITGNSSAAGRRKLNTVAKIAPIYAPASENKTSQWIDNVCLFTGFKPDQVLTEKDVPTLARGITRAEGGSDSLAYFYPAQRFPGMPPGGGGGGGGGGPTTRSISGPSLINASPSAAYQASIRSIDNQLLGGSGTPQSSYMKDYISPADRLQIGYLNLILRTNKEVAKNTKDANTAAGIRPGGIIRGGSQRGTTTDPFTRYYQSRIQSLAQQFENTTRSLINTTLTSVLFPGKFFGVSRRQAEQPGYLGNLITKELELQKKMTPFFNKLLGRRFGGQYASLFSQAGGLLLDKGANAFGAMLGFDSRSPFGFGQIVGNLLTKGRQGKEARRLGMEQLIYSMTGIPLGAQSGLAFLQKTFPSFFGPMAGGYMTPQQQIAAMTGSTMGILNPGMMFGQTLAGGMNMIPGSATQMQMAMLSRPTTYDGTRMTADTAALAKVQAAESAYISETQTQAQQGFFENLGDTFSAGFSGLFKILGFGGGPGGGSFMNFGGSTAGGGGFFSNLATTGTNMLAMYGGYKLMQKIGGKNQNPVVTMLGTIALSQGLKIGAGMALDAMGYGAVAKTLGLPTSLPSLGGATTGITGGGIGSAGAAETGLTMAGGAADSAAAYGASLGGYGVVPGFGSATTTALQAAPGTQAASAFLEANAATSSAGAAGGAEFLAAAAEAIPIVAAVYAVYRIVKYFAFDKGDTRATYSIYVKGNNDVNAGEIVHAEKTDANHWKLVENFGKAGFVMIKKIESQGVKPDFDYLTVQISFNPHRNVQMGFNDGGPGKGDRKKTPINVGPLDLRKPVDATVIKVIMDNMAKLIAERMSKASSAKSQSDLEASLKTITKPEMEGNIAGIDRNVYKDVAGRTSAAESIAARATPEMQTEFNSDGSSIESFTGNMSVFNAKTGQMQIVSGDSGILGFDAAGNPITSASLAAAKAVPSQASSITSGASLTYQQQQDANEQLKNSNPTTATNASSKSAVVNSGNQIDNSSKTTVINTSLRDEGYMFGAYRQSEFDRFSVAA